MDLLLYHRLRSVFARPEAQALVKKRFRRPGAPPCTGLCYVASEVVARLDPSCRPMRVEHEGIDHYYLLCGEQVVDLTAEQFSTLPDYSRGRPTRFKPQPSARAVKLARLIGRDLTEA